MQIKITGELIGEPKSNEALKHKLAKGFKKKLNPDGVTKNLSI